MKNSQINLLFFLYLIPQLVFAQNDSHSWCNNSQTYEKVPQLVVLFDKTENYERELILNIIEKVTEEKEKVDEGLKVSFFTFDKETGFHASIFTDTFCIIGNPSKFLSNKREVKIKKKKENERIKEFFNANNPLSGTNGSPIADAFISMSRSQLLATSASNLKVILVSDLVENSNKAKLGSRAISVEEARKLAEDLSIGHKVPLKTDVLVLYVQRQKYLPVQSGDSLELLWRKFFKNIGVIGEVKFIKIQ
jgi:hypothetical protein